MVSYLLVLPSLLGGGERLGHEHRIRISRFRTRLRSLFEVALRLAGCSMPDKVVIKGDDIGLTSHEQLLSGIAGVTHGRCCFLRSNDDIHNY